MNSDTHSQETSFHFPPIKILKSEDSEIILDEIEIAENKNLILEALEKFGIPILNIQVLTGPVATLYEITLPDNNKISKIRAIKDDISLNLKESGLSNVRIVAPIPYKKTIGIEIANKKKKSVRLRNILSSQDFQENKFSLPLAIGATFEDKPYVVDLYWMPHLLIAGKDDCGTSVLQNVIITSLLYSKKPEDIKFVLIDPTKVEFSSYNKIECQYIAKNPLTKEAVVTDIRDIETTLYSLCVEMDNRFKLLQEASVRDLREYNANIVKSKSDSAKFNKLPYVVVMVDRYELLLKSVGKKIEKNIIMLAQKGKTVGIHLILSTYRPASEFISPAIKANFPASISFKLDSKENSKRILDQYGAEILYGKGDMLIYNNFILERVQGAYMEEAEINELCDYISKSANNCKPYLLPEVRYE